MSAAPAARLAELVRDRYGVFTSRQAQGADITRAQIRRFVDRGMVERILPAVYASTAHPDTWERRALVAQLAGGDNAVLSHGAAARILGLEHLGVGRSPAIELTYPRDRRIRETPVRTHESLILSRDDVVEHGCFRVTNAVFTIGALALRRSPHRIARALDAAIERRRTSATDARDLAVRMWHTPGVVCLREAIEQLTPAAEMTRSDRERLFLRICRTFDLPLPDANVRVVDANGDRRYVDFLFRDEGLVVEVNAHPSHATTLGKRRDGLRQNALVPRFVVLNFDARDLTGHPDRVAAEVRRSLAELSPR